MCSKNKVLPAFLLVFFVLSAACCKDTTGIFSSRSRLTARVIFHTPGEKDVEVLAETARTPAERAHGLMGRKYLAPNHGMLFIFPEEGQLTFWMKDTFIELDMIFIRADFTVVGCVERAAPLTTTPRSVEGAARYVLEVNGGFCELHNISSASKAEIFINGERI